MHRAVCFTFHVTVPPSDGAYLWVPRPFEDDWQRSIGEALPADLPVERGVDAETGTSMLRFSLPRSTGAFATEVSFTVERRERAHARPAADHHAHPVEGGPLAKFLRSDSRLRADGTNLERARAIASADEPPSVIARKIFDHLLATMTYDARGCTPERSHALGDLEAACELGSGTCTEFHGLFVAYCRALGVPARLCFGFNLPRGARSGAIRGYHCWAEIALPDGSWFPVDVSEASKRRELADFYFGSLDADRIAFTYGRDVLLAPPQRAPRLDRFIFPYAEVAGSPVEPALAFSFADVLVPG